MEGGLPVRRVAITKSTYPPDFDTLLARPKPRYNAGMVKIPHTLISSVFAITCGFACVSPIALSFADSAVEDSIREEDRLGARSDQYSRVFDKAVSALVKGDSASFCSMLSSTTVVQETRGPGAIDAVIQDAFIPFFVGFEELTDAISTAPTYDVSGKTGIAIARSFKTKSGETKPFVIYLINETREGKDVVAVGNLLINTTGEVLQKSTTKNSSSSAAAR